MKAQDAYKKSQDRRMPRVDLILTIYDRIMELLDRARGQLGEGGKESAKQLTLARTAMAGLASAVAADNTPLGVNFFRLYEFILHCLQVPTQKSIDDAQRILNNLRDAFQNVRGQALEMERTGQIPSLDQSHLLQTTV